MAGEEVLIADSSAKDRSGLVALCERRGLVPSAVDTAHVARDQITGKFYAIVIVDLDLAGGGLDLVQFTRERSVATQLVALTSRKNYEPVVSAFRAGCIDVVFKRPEELVRLDSALDVALDRYRESAGRGSQDVVHFLDELTKAFVTLGRKLYASEIDSLTQVSRTSLAALLVDEDQRFLEAMSEKLKGLPIEASVEFSGGGALDKIGSSRFDLVVAHDAMADLPGSIVLNAAQQRNPECVGLLYTNRGASGRIERIVEGRVVDTYTPFATAVHLAERVRELVDEEGIRRRERRVLQVIGNKHGELLRKYAEIKRRLEARV